MTTFPPLSAIEIQRGLASNLLGCRVEIHPEITSTNDRALEIAAELGRDAEGTIVLAELQTAGRGRHGRRWIAPVGANILLSVLLFPPEELARPELLVCLSSVASAEALEEFLPASLSVDPRVRIKWPNDLYLGDRKLAGMLVERGGGTVLGIGVNVHVAPTENADFAATALSPHASQALDRNAIIRRMLERLDARYRQLLAGGVDELAAVWKRRAAFVGRMLDLKFDDGPTTGKLLEIDPLQHIAWIDERGRTVVRPIAQLRSIGLCPPDRPR